MARCGGRLGRPRAPCVGWRTCGGRPARAARRPTRRRWRALSRRRGTRHGSGLLLRRSSSSGWSRRASWTRPRPMRSWRPRDRACTGKSGGVRWSDWRPARRPAVARPVRRRIGSRRPRTRPRRSSSSATPTSRAPLASSSCVRTARRSQPWRRRRRAASRHRQSAPRSSTRCGARAWSWSATSPRPEAAVAVVAAPVPRRRRPKRGA